MRNQQLHSDLQQLRALIESTDVVTQNIGLQGHWGKYLCVLVAGFLENSLQTIYSDFATRSSSPQMQRFVSKQLERIRNPNAERFLQTAGNFDPAWRIELENFLNADIRRREAIDSIMRNRNQIAHGDSSSITLSRVKGYLDDCVEVVEFIENQCGN